MRASGTVAGPGFPPGGPALRSGAGGVIQGVTRESYLTAQALPGAVPQARCHTRQMLARWRLGRIGDDTELVVSELITNAVTASAALPFAAEVALYLAAADGRLYVLVWDASPELPVHRAHDEEAACGRGLEIVAALTERRGTFVLDQGGKVVWAWLRLDCP